MFLLVSADVQIWWPQNDNWTLSCKHASATCSVTSSGNYCWKNKSIISCIFFALVFKFFLSLCEKQLLNKQQVRVLVRVHTSRFLSVLCVAKRNFSNVEPRSSKHVMKTLPALEAITSGFLSAFNVLAFWINRVNRHLGWCTLQRQRSLLQVSWAVRDRASYFPGCAFNKANGCMFFF